MKVRDLIARLQEMDPELPVTVRDYQSDYGDEFRATMMEVVDDRYEAHDPETEHTEWTSGRHLRIG